MAKDVSITARELNTEASELANWLTRELRVVRPGTEPVPEEPPVVEASPPPPPPVDEPPMAPPVEASAVAASAVATAAAATAEEAPVEAVAPAPAVEVAAPLESEARANHPGTEAPPADLFASSEDWSNDDDAFFASPPEGSDDDSADDFFAAGAASTDAVIGESLSPQVLESEDAEVEAPLAIPGTASTPYWKVAAGVAAAVLLAFLFAHRGPKPHAAVAAQPTPLAAAPEVPTPPKASMIEDLPVAEAEDTTASTPSKGGGSDFGGRHAPPSTEPNDPAIAGGPSVARFPDLPRDILNALEQAFQSGEGQKSKPKADSVGGY